MSRELFTSIVKEIINHSVYFRDNTEYTRRDDILAFNEVYLHIRQLVYDTVPDAIDKYLQMGVTTSHESLDYFCKSLMEIFLSRVFSKTYLH